MAEKEFHEVAFTNVGGMFLLDEVVCKYANEHYGFEILVRSKTKNNKRVGRCSYHYKYNGVVYKKEKGFLEAIKDVVVNDSQKVAMRDCRLSILEIKLFALCSIPIFKEE